MIQSIYIQQVYHVVLHTQFYVDQFLKTTYDRRKQSDDQIQVKKVDPKISVHTSFTKTGAFTIGFILDDF